MQDKEFRRKLLKLVIPITMQQIMVSLVSLTDAVMLGFLAQDALSAVSLAGQVMFVFTLFIYSVTGGVILCVIPFIPLFDNISQTAQDYLKIMLIVSSYYVVGKAMNMTVISGIFPSGGDSKFGLIANAANLSREVGGFIDFTHNV